ncbi:MAG: alkaline phosphatase family protein [Sedimentisphaeraceae bacterium JB056]
MTKILIIGLDGFSWTSGKRLMDDGFMPNLRNLCSKGCCGNLKSVFPFETSPAWSSFQTGCRPEKTGIYCFHKFDTKSNKLRVNSLADNKAPDIWTILTKSQKKVISINMPVSFPCPEVEGVFVPGLLCPEINSDNVYPSKIYNKYLKGTNYKIVENRHIKDLDDFVEESIKTENVRFDLAEKLIVDYQWDLFSIQVQTTDLFQHRAWATLDPGAKGYSKDVYAKASLFYSQLDSRIGQLLSSAGQDVLTFIVSDHGFCKYEGSIGLNRWLLDNGYLVLSTIPDSDTKFSKTKEVLKSKFSIIKYAAKFYGKIKKKLFTKNINYSEEEIVHLRRIIDMDKTAAFCLGGLGGLIYINPCCENKESIVERLADEIRSSFGDGKAVKEIQRGEEVYPSGYDRPDIVVKLNEGWQITLNPFSPVIEGNTVRNGLQIGTHSPEGVFVLSGEKVKNKNNNCELIDITPTILALLGIDIPAHIDGKALTDCFSFNFKTNFTDKDTAVRSHMDYSDSEQEDVEQQLTDLGYL